MDPEATYGSFWILDNPDETRQNPILFSISTKINPIPNPYPNLNPYPNSNPNPDPSVHT